jgi:hypothetical protein
MTSELKYLVVGLIIYITYISSVGGVYIAWSWVSAAKFVGLQDVRKSYSETKSPFKAHLIDARAEDKNIYKVYKDLTFHMLYFLYFMDAWVYPLAHPVHFLSLV